MRSGVGVLDAFWPVASENWQRFAAQMRLASVYPGLQGIGFAARVDTPEQFQHWSAALRRFGSNDLDDWPRDSGRLPATAIVFLEPLDESNRLALGYDMMSEPRRRAAMERARDSGSPALSAKIVLVQDLRRGLRTAGFLLFLPVYSSPTLPATVAERRQALRGFVYSPLRAEHFFQTTLAGSSSTAFVEVFDGDAPSTDTLLYRSGAAVPADSMADTRRLPLGGSTWTLRVSRAGTSLSLANSAIPWIGLGGVVDDAAAGRVWRRRSH